MNELSHAFVTEAHRVREYAELLARFDYLRDNPAGCAACHELPGDREREEERKRNATR